MSSEKIRGVIIRETFSGEADKFLTIFAKDKGKVSVFAKGARNTKSKFLAVSSLFTYADFIIRTATKTPTLMTADVIENFYNIRTDIAAAAYASYFAELIEKTTFENVAENDALLLLLKSLQYLSRKGNNARLTGIVFQLRYLDILGFRPDPEELYKYSLSTESVSVIEYILSSDMGKAFRVVPEEDCIREIENFLEKYIEFYIDSKFKSYEMIKQCCLV